METTIMDAAGGVLSDATTATEIIDGGTLTTSFVPFTETFGPSVTSHEAAQAVMNGMEHALDAQDIALDAMTAQVAANLGMTAEKVSRMSALMTKYPALNTAANKYMSFTYNVGEFVTSRPYLAGPYNFVANGWRAVSSRVASLARAIGPKAGFGYAVAVLTSEKGRRRLSKSILFLYRQQMKVRNSLVRGLRHLWIPGNLMANMLQWSYDKELDFYKWVADKYNTHLADHLAVEKPYIQAAKIGGLALGGITMARALMSSHPIIGGIGVLLQFGTFVYNMGVLAGTQGWLGKKVQDSDYLFNLEADARAKEAVRILAEEQKTKLTRNQRVIAMNTALAEVHEDMLNERAAKAAERAAKEAQAKSEQEQADAIRKAGGHVSAGFPTEPVVHTVTTLPSSSVVGSSNNPNSRNK